MGIAHVPQGRGTFADLTVQDNLRVGAYVAQGRHRADIDRLVRGFPRLSERHEQHAGSLSGGEQQMLAVARALMSTAEAAVAATSRRSGSRRSSPRSCSIASAAQRREGLTMLVVEQNANLALDIAPGRMCSRPVPSC